MAEIFPSLESIQQLAVKPTEGELFLLNHLANNLSDDYEIYYKPFLNGDIPDIVIMRRGSGVVIIEVKDWDLNAYNVDEDNNWHEREGGRLVLSPVRQAFGYKSNMIKLHIDGLAEKNVMNKNFFNVLKALVYFHGATKSDIDNLYIPVEESLKAAKQNLNDGFRARQIDYNSYTIKMDYFDQKSKEIRIDRGLSLFEENLQKLTDALKSKHVLFDDEIYDEFRRYLSPSPHMTDHGTAIKYDANQAGLVVSTPGFRRVKGVAGCGKTTVLAQRAVNAHKRHNDKVLIFTYNKTLRTYIRNKLSEVRESFSWEYFGITNYHSFITQALNQCGIPISPPDDYAEAQAYFHKLYTNLELFDGYSHTIDKYQTILLDEVQDYRREWIEIIRKYFLADDGEMILFGDEGQNIYDRVINNKLPTDVKGFGRWKTLKKSYRSQIESPIIELVKLFQIMYLAPKYEIELIDSESESEQTTLVFGSLHGIVFFDKDDIRAFYHSIFQHLKNENIPFNDVAIISTSIGLLRKLDQMIREEGNEETQTMFEREDVYLELAERYNGKPNQLRRELNDIRGSKKLAFNPMSGLMTLSTVQSFKGLESPTVIYISLENDGDEMVYTGITRAKTNNIIFIPDSSMYLDFFQTVPHLQLKEIDSI